MISDSIHDTLDELIQKAVQESLTRAEFDRAMKTLRSAACEVRELELQRPPQRLLKLGDNVLPFPGAFPRAGKGGAA